jgi:hypothetical protein
MKLSRGKAAVKWAGVCGQDGQGPSLDSVCESGERGEELLLG